MFSKLIGYTGRRDRERIKRGRDEESKRSLEPRSELEKAIFDNRAVINRVISDKAKLTPNDSLNVYLNARSNKHDIWVDYLKQTKGKYYYTFNDIKVSDFHDDFRKKFNVPDMPENLRRLTPDILVYDIETSTIFIGDVSCTNSVRDADRRKYLKYKNIASFYEENGYRVKHMNFIIDNNLSNLSQIIREFENTGLILPVEGIRSRSIHYFRMARVTMEDALTYCKDVVALKNMIDISDRVVDDTYDQILLPNGVTFPEVNREEPSISEDTIGKMIMDQVNNLGDDYFDSGIEDTVSALNDLKEKNRNREHMAPKSTLKVCSNPNDKEIDTDHKLIESYLADLALSDNKEILDYLKWMLPSRKQVKLMSDSKNNIIKDDKENGVYGPYQYKIPRGDSDSMIVNDTLRHLQLGKKIKNTKREPKTIDPDRYDECFQSIENVIEYYGKISDKPSFLDSSWDCSTQFEADNSDEMRKIYNIIANTNGAQVAHSLSGLYQRLCHLKTSLSTKDNIYIPPNGSFIAIIPKDHAPVTSSSCDVPVIFISRVNKKSPSRSDFVSGNEYEYFCETDDFIYTVSKLCRLSITKMQNWENAGYRLCATASYICSLNPHISIRRVVGILSIMMLDVHQKTSELLDLLKYVAFMPFSDITRLSTLIKDKFNIMLKTNLDVWTILTLEKFIKELSLLDKLDAVKPKLQLHNGMAIHESFGMKLKLPSIFDMGVRHEKPDTYIEEIAMIYTVRGKQLYGSQFMDKSISMTAELEDNYQEEISKHGNWVIDGSGEDNYPFDSQFAFSKDAILHALNHFKQTVPISVSKAMKEVNSGTYNDFLHYNCSLRGAVKEPEDRKKPSDLHTTSMEACLLEYQKNDYKSEVCTSNEIAYKMMRSMKKMEFSMSEKEQRGGGRPIATPTLQTKAALMLLEKPEVAIGKQSPNNVIVPGKNKLQEQCESYKKFITQAALEGYKQVYQLTEDQTKFSEMDNPRKFIPYISNNDFLDVNVRRLQLKVIEMLNNREHLVKHIPQNVKDGHLARHINAQGNGIKTSIGWPQGMCNFMSTSIHMIADYWITKIYNTQNPGRAVKTAGLVHSDDSWVVVAANSQEDFKHFCKFRIVAKRLFCLKMNEKKLWGSKYLGELVSNYNINGNVHLCIAKTIANAFTGLTYQNWVLDVHTQISVLQQSYRNGANIPVLILLATILRQQILSSYQIKGLQRDMLYELPVELGGYPSNSVFELAVTGLNCHYNTVLNNIKKNPNSKVAEIVLKCLRLSINRLTSIEQDDFSNEVKKHARTKISKEYILDDDQDEFNLRLDFNNVQLPYRGDVFSCINHLMPQSKKVKMTVMRLRGLPFTSDGLELLVTRPKDLSVALGHLKEQTSSMLYTLAAEKYTQSARRLAVSQSLQSTGKTVRLNGLKPMTMNELLETILMMTTVVNASITQLETAFTDSNPMPDLSAAIVYNSESVYSTNDKRKIINRLPDIDDNFKTLSPIKDILLYIIEEAGYKDTYTKYSTKKSPIQLVREESEIIKRRFATYFMSYRVKPACNLIMKLSMESKKTRLWMQPYLNQETIVSFLEDLYGKTVSSDFNYRITTNGGYDYSGSRDSDLVKTMYTCCVLDSLYDRKFRLQMIDGETVDTIVGKIDYTKLSMDDLLKYAIVRYYVNGDDLILREYDRCRLFSKKYIKPQAYVNGKYVGDFICELKYGGTVVKVSGKPGDVKVVVNRLNINEVMMAMMLFINDSFPSERYSHPTLWHQCPVWGSVFKAGTLFLTSYTQSVSNFTTSSIINSIPIEKNENLKYDDLFVEMEECNYLVDEHLRVLYKIKGEDKIRIGNVKQNMSCPMAKATYCFEDSIDGLSNNELLHTKIILNLTMRRPFANSKKDLEQLIKNSENINDGILITMYKNMLAKFTNSITPRDYQNMQKLEIMDDITITGFDTNTYIFKADETQPEDLTYIETNFIYNDEEEVNAMIKYNNVIRYVCQCYMINQTMEDRDTVLRALINDPNIIKMIVQDAKSEESDDILDAMIESAGRDSSVEVLCFVITHDLDLISGWDEVDLHRFMREDFKYDLVSVRMNALITSIKCDMDKIIFNNEYEDNKNELLLMHR